VVKRVVIVESQIRFDRVGPPVRVERLRLREVLVGIRQDTGAGGRLVDPIEQELVDVRPVVREDEPDGCVHVHREGGIEADSIVCEVLSDKVELEYLVVDAGGFNAGSTTKTVR